MRQNSIGQIEPENWRALSVANVAAIRKTFNDEHVEEVINADHTFVKFFQKQSTSLQRREQNDLVGKSKQMLKLGSYT